MLAKALRTAVLAGIALAAGGLAAGEAKSPLEAFHEGDYAIYSVTLTVTPEGAEEATVLEGMQRFSVLERTDEAVTLEKTVTLHPAGQPDGDPVVSEVASRTFPLNREASPALLFDIILGDDALEVAELKVVGKGTEPLYVDALGEEDEECAWFSLQVLSLSKKDEDRQFKQTAKIFLSKHLPLLNVARIESEGVAEGKGGRMAVSLEMEFVEGGSDD